MSGKDVYVEESDNSDIGDEIDILDTDNIFDAIQNNDLINVIRIVFKGINLEEEDLNQENITPLMFACKEGHIEIVGCLLINGADINYENEYGLTAIRYACQYGHLNIVQLLLANGADPNIIDSCDISPLGIAIDSGYREIVLELLNYPNIVIELPCDVDLNIMIKACELGWTDVVSRLLDLGAGIEESELCNEIPLHMASQSGHVDLVRMLLERGANINSVNEDGNTALTMASVMAHINVVKLLLVSGANIHILNYENEKVFEFGGVENNQEIYELLINWDFLTTLYVMDSVGVSPYCMDPDNISMLQEYLMK